MMHHSTPSTPTSPSAAAELKPLPGLASISGGASLDSRSVNLELLREQLRAAKIPLTKQRGSIVNELPQSAEDCQLLPGTTRCQLELCEDDCAQPHRHHRTHARPLKPDATLVYSRPSISLLPGSGLASSYGGSPVESPAASLPTSQTNSPQQTYRRASAYGFQIGARGSVISSLGFGAAPQSGVATPADFASGPPSPVSEISEGSSAAPSMPSSPRPAAHHHTTSSGGSASAFTTDFCPSIAEEKETSVAAGAAVGGLAPSTSSEMVVGSVVDSHADFWQLRNHIVNLHDYAPSVVGKYTAESKARRDLAPAPRDDCPEQEDCAWDPRSPQAPTRVDALRAQLIRVNMNQEDGTQPEIEYELKPTN